LEESTRRSPRGNDAADVADDLATAPSSFMVIMETVTFIFRFEDHLEREHTRPERRNRALDRVGGLEIEPIGLRVEERVRR
jgi:hypothetical protein